MMLFPELEKEKICERFNCPSRSIKITQGMCITKKNGKYVQADSETPSVVILFRDPTIEDSNPDRYVKNVLDIDVSKKEIISTLFTFYKTYFLDICPENEIIYLDNFVRCKMPFKRKDLENNFLSLSDPYATCCYDISRSLLCRLPNLKCLIISDVKPVIWLGKKGFMTDLDSETKKFIDRYIDGKSKHGMNSTILLNKRFQLENFNFPVFFFLHPNTLQLQYKNHYAPGKDYEKVFENHLHMISNILK